MKEQGITIRPRFVFKAVVIKEKKLVVVTGMDYIRNCVFTTGWEGKGNQKTLTHDVYSADDLIFIDYLGVKDSEDKPIFNHDIVFYDGNYYEITREGLKIILINPKSGEVIKGSEVDPEDLMVAGNIYHDPELLANTQAV